MANEKRFIDAYALMDRVRDSKRHNPHDDPTVARNHMFEHDHFMKMVSLAPIVDAVEVVRCKDCRFYERDVEYYPDGTKDVCRLLKRQMLEDGFCSVGERKDGGADDGI